MLEESTFWGRSVGTTLMFRPFFSEPIRTNKRWTSSHSIELDDAGGSGTKGGGIFHDILMFGKG